MTNLSTEPVDLAQQVTQLDKELSIVSQESRELQDQLVQKDKDIHQKTIELREKSGVVEHLRQSNVRVEEHLERSKHRVESLMTRLEETLSCLQHTEAKATRKDSL